MCHKQFKSRPRMKRPAIQTLDPSRLRSSDFIDASLVQNMCLLSHLATIPFTTYYTQRNCDHFPTGTRGFLYYHPPNPGAPLVAGQVRFRLTPGNDPASFIHGSDLQMPNGLPWGIPLLAIVRGSLPDPDQTIQHHPFLRENLINDGFLTPTLLETCEAMVKANEHAPTRSSHIIHSFDQLFHVKFDRIYLYLFVLANNQLQRQRFIGLFSARKASLRRIAPYQGEYQCSIFHAHIV
jgi:hypothetical protein